MERQELQIGVKNKRLCIPFYQQKIGAKNKHIHPYSQIIFFLSQFHEKNPNWFANLGMNAVGFFLLNLFILDIDRF